jgi:hypothetical protein
VYLDLAGRYFPTSRPGKLGVLRPLKPLITAYDSSITIFKIVATVGVSEELRFAGLRMGGGGRFNEGPQKRGAPGLALFETCDSTTMSISGFPRHNPLIVCVERTLLSAAFVLGLLRFKTNGNVKGGGQECPPHTSQRRRNSSRLPGAPSLPGAPGLALFES